jgi:hypothetical protein
MPNLVPTSANPSFNKIHNDFIRHPQQFPLEFKRVRAWRRSLRAQQMAKGDLGLSFVSPKYIATGTDMELSIPLRGIVQKFHGTVVMVREIVGGFEIGIWLASEDEASRARLVEQICHIECYLQQRTRHAGELSQSSRAFDRNITRPSVFGPLAN